MKIILGSSSKFRAEEMQKAGYAFEVVSADIDEKSIRTENLFELPLMLAEAKADAVIAKLKEPGIVIAADAIVIANGELREKPESAEQNRIWLRSYAEAPAHIVVGLVVHNASNGKRSKIIDDCLCYFEAMPEDRIEWYINEGTCLTTAGGFTNEIVNEFGKEPIASSDRRRGIPIDLVKKLIKEVQ